MTELLDCGIGLAGMLSVSWLGNAQEIVSIFCSLAIAIVTCGITIYRMIRDRDKDKHSVSEENEEHNEEK